jgi:hypothetical protein
MVANLGLEPARFGLGLLEHDVQDGCHHAFLPAPCVRIDAPGNRPGNGKKSKMVELMPEIAPSEGTEMVVSKGRVYDKEKGVWHEVEHAPDEKTRKKMVSG